MTPTNYSWRRKKAYIFRDKKRDISEQVRAQLDFLTLASDAKKEQKDVEQEKGQ